MIVRILGEGQFELSEETLAHVNTLDDTLMAAVEANDENAFRESLDAIHKAVVEQGERLDDEQLVPSGLILPDSSATITEVALLLGDDGLIPG